MSKFKGGLDAYKQRTKEIIEQTEPTDKENLQDDKEPLPLISTNQSNEIIHGNNLSQNVSLKPHNISLDSKEENKTNRKESKDFQQVNSYVPKQLYKKVKIALVEEERGISDLITELLNNWVNSRHKE